MRPPVNRAGGDFHLKRITALLLSTFLFAACGYLGAVTVPLAPTPPTAPTGLAATPGNSSVSLVWNASAGATSYKVSRGASSGGPYTTTVATGLTATAYTDTTVTNGATYAYVVTAINVAGESTESAPASATPDAPPAAPTGLTAVPGNGSVALAWNASIRATSYQISRGTVSGGPYTPTIATGQTTTAANDVSLPNGTTYFYIVTALNAAGESAKSAQASATPIAPPAAPTGLIATSGNGSISLVWSASAGAASYQIWQAVSGVSLGNIPLAIGVTALDYTDTHVTTGTLYVYWVAAVNAGGASALSEFAQATAGPPPAAPTGFTATSGNGSVALAWNASAGANSYKVKRGTVPGGPYTEVATSNPPNMNFTDRAAANGTTYYYVVTALNGAGESVNSIEASATPIAQPAAPTGLAATSANGSVSLTWIAPVGAASYMIWRAVSGVQLGNVPLVTGLTAAIYTDTQVTKGTSYVYWVQAVNAGGTGPLSGAVTILVIE